MTRHLLAVTVRAAVLWGMLRILLAGAAAGLEVLLSGPGAPPPRMTMAPAAALLLAGVTAVLVLADGAALRERVFLANLGVGRRHVAAAAFLTAAALEGLVYLAAPA